MIEVGFHIILILLVVFFLGSGLTLFILPQPLQRYAFWLTPWVFFLFLIVVLVPLSLGGVPIASAAPFFILGLSVLNFFVFIKQKKRYLFIFREDIIISIFVISAIVLHLLPIIRRDNFLTTASFGNNDVIVYAASADYLVKHSIFESFHTQVAGAIGTILNDGYRWGPPALLSFFLYLFRVEAHQYTYFMQVILYSLMIPLGYTLFKIIYKPSLVGLIIVSAIVAYNANMTYILYNNFFGQVLHWGIFMIILIVFVSYMNVINEHVSGYNRYDLLAGLSLAAMLFSYHEATPMILVPLLIYIVVKLIQKYNVIVYIKTFYKIGFTAFFITAPSLFRIVVLDFQQAFQGNPNQPIGWQLFRSKVPFPNPFEMVGFYSIHNFDPLPLAMAVVLSLAVVYVISVGFIQVRYKLFVGAYLFIIILFDYWTGIYQHNFWTYYRAVTYTLPVVLVLFGVGISHILAGRQILLKVVVVSLLVGLAAFSGRRLNQRFIHERLAVEKSMISLRQLLRLESKEKIYAEGFLDPTTPLWKQIWTGYFLYPTEPEITFYERGLGARFYNSVLDGRRVLISKSNPWIKGPQVILRKVLWENEAFMMGELCSSEECLLSSPYDLSKLNIGESPYEDSLLMEGWSVRESGGRWANAMEVAVRLVSKNTNSFSRLVIESLALAEPQNMSVYINGVFLGSQGIKKDWDTYEFPLSYLPAGIHQITLKFSHTYSPVSLGISSDLRELPARFKLIAFE